MAREYTREWYLERMSWIHGAKRDISITSDMIVGFPGEDGCGLRTDDTLLDEVKYDAGVCVQVLAAAEYSCSEMADSIPDEVKTERLKILMDRQREIQREHYGRHSGPGAECNGREL